MTNWLRKKIITQIVQLGTAHEASEEAREPVTQGLGQDSGATPFFQSSVLVRKRARCSRERREPKPRSVVDPRVGPVADLTLRSTPQSKERTPDWGVAIHPSTHPSNNPKRPHNRHDPKPRRDRQTGNQKKKVRRATLRRKNGVWTFKFPCSFPRNCCDL